MLDKLKRYCSTDEIKGVFGPPVFDVRVRFQNRCSAAHQRGRYATINTRQFLSTPRSFMSLESVLGALLNA